MLRVPCRLLPILSLALYELLSPHILRAQPLWIDVPPPQTISVEILKPVFEDKNATTFSTAAVFLSLRSERSPYATVIAEWPIAYGDVDIEPGIQKTRMTIGNPYFGMLFGSRHIPISGEFGIRVPLAPNDQNTVTLATDPVDRIEAFRPKRLPISGMVNFSLAANSGFRFRVRSGPMFWVEIGTTGRTEWFMLYSAQASYTSSHISVLGGLSGRRLITDDRLDLVVFGGRHAYHTVWTVTMHARRYHPGVQIRVPLNDHLRRIQGWVLGLHLSVRL